MKIHDNYLKNGKVNFYISIYFIKNTKKRPITDRFLI